MKHLIQRIFLFRSKLYMDKDELIKTLESRINDVSKVADPTKKHLIEMYNMGVRHAVEVVRLYMD